MERLKIGRTYKMSDYDVICTGFTKKGKAKMQTYGMTYGRWPGTGDISQYDEKTKAFTSEWEDIISKFQLPSLKRVKKNECVKAALKTAAENCSSFGATYYNSWLGTVSGSNSAWCVHSNGNVYHNNGLYNSCVVAPAFNLDTSKVIVDGDEIKRKAEKTGTKEVRFNVTCYATYQSRLNVPVSADTGEKVLAYIREHLAEANAEELEYLSDLDDPYESVTADDIVDIEEVA